MKTVSQRAPSIVRAADIIDALEQACELYEREFEQGATIKARTAGGDCYFVVWYAMPKKNKESKTYAYSS